MIDLQTYIPTTLSSVVKCFWRLTVLCPENYQEDILPDGHQEIIFHTDEHTAQRTILADNWIKEPTCFFAGQTRRKYSLALKSGSVLYGIRFLPHTIRLLFSLPVQDCTDNLVSLDNIREAKVLQDCIGENAEATFSNFEDALSQSIRWAGLSDNSFRYINASVLEILTCNGSTKIDELIKKAGISGKYFDKLFLEYVGLTPKQFCSIVQLNYFIRYKTKNPNKKLTECVYEANYYDQSHLIRFFRHFSGKTPRAYLESNNQISSLFSEF